jgi:PAS domain S-box-containing protein
MSDSERLGSTSASTTEELEKANAALEASRAQNRSLYAHAVIAYVTLDHEGIIRDVNLTAAELLRSTVEALIGKAFLSVVSTDQHDEFWAHLRTVAATREPMTTELRIRVRAEQVMSVRLMSAPIGEGGREILTALFDMSEQRRGEQIMLFLDRAAMLFGPVTAPNVIAEEVSALAVPMLADFCVVELRDAEGTTYVASTHVDPSLAPALQATRQVFTRLPGVREAVERAFSSGQPQVIEPFRPARRDLREMLNGTKANDLLAVRELHMQSLVVLPLMGRGQVFGMLALAQVDGRQPRPASDLSIALELARRAALAIDNGRLFMELQDANQTKDHFLAVLSHELRTPLTPVLAAVSAALSRGLPEPPEFLGMLEMIERNVELERRLIDDLLDLSRVSRGKLELSRELVDLRRVVENAVKICRHDANKQGIALSVDLRAERHHADADAGRLEQILWNLLKNAIKFTERGGSVSVTMTSEKDVIRISVADTGIGIDPNDLARIFAPFTQADPLGRRRGGMGLGLAISRTLAEAHGGRVFAQSRGRGKGSTFIVELPAAPAPAVADESLRAERHASPSLPPETPIRVLLVEDDVDTLEVTSALLRESHYQVVTADSVASARDSASHAAFDVLVSDINLPDGSGLDLMRELRASGKPVPGIALSGFGMREDVERARHAGFAAHLTKPITFPKLEETIGKVLRRPSTRSSNLA